MADLSLITPPPCVMLGLPHDEYLACEGLSRSELVRIINKTPYHHHELRRDDPLRPPPPEAGPQLVAGTLCHCATLEPLQFDRRYVVGPEVKTKAAKAWKDFEAANPDRECITPLQYRIAQAQAAALRATRLGDSPEDGTLGDLLVDANTEPSAFWVDAETGLLCKCRPDVAALTGDEQMRGWILVDVKTTASAGPNDFNSSVAKFSYDMQAAHYSAGWEIATGLPVLSFLFACVEHEYPFATALYALPDDWLAYGRACCRDALTLWAECERTGRFPGYPVGVQTLQPSKWHPVAQQRRERERALLY